MCSCHHRCGCYCFRKRYGVMAFLWDCFMTCITCGFWLIRIYVRERRG